MAISRRFFVLGGSGVISAAVLREARAAAEVGEVLLTPPSGATRELFVEWVEDVGRLHLGAPTFELPPAPLWIEHLQATGQGLQTAREIADFCDRNDCDEEDLWQPVDEFGWEDYWEHSGSPEAQAYTLLDTPSVGRKLRQLTGEGKLEFHAYPNPMSSARWVEVSDPLSLTLLQAQLNGLGLSIAVKELPRELYP